LIFRLLFYLIIILCTSICVTAQIPSDDDDRLRSVIHELLVQADKFSSQQILDSAIQLAEEARQYADSLRDNNLKSNICTRLSNYYSQYWQYQNARDRIKQAITLQEKADPPDSISLANNLERLAHFYSQLHEPEKALKIFNQAFEIKKNLYGYNSPEIAKILNTKAVYLNQLDSNDLGEECKRESMRILQKILDPDSEDYEDILEYIAQQYFTLHNFSAAEGAYLKLKAIKQDRLEEDHSEILRIDQKLIDVYELLGKFDDQKKNILRLLKHSREKYGEKDPRTANYIFSLAKHYRSVTNYPDAEYYLLQALAIWDSLPGFYAHLKMQVMREMGRILVNQARYEDALEYLQRGKDLFHEGDYKRSSVYSNILNYFGNAYMGLGRYDEANLAYHEAMVIRIKNGGSRNPGIGEPANNLGELHYTIGNYDSARVYFDTAIVVREPRYGMYNSYMLYSRLGLAKVYTKLGDYIAADSNFDIASQICETAYDSIHLHRAWILEGKGELALKQQEYETAESLFMEALRIKDAIFDTIHAEKIPIMENLALIYGLNGDFPKSLDYFQKLLEIRHYFVNDVFSYTSEDQRIKFIRSNPLILNEMLSVALLADSREFREATLLMVLKGKAALIEASKMEKQFMFCSKDPIFDSLWNVLNEIKGQISDLTLSAFGAEQPDFFADSLQSLNDYANSVDKELKMKCNDYEDYLASKDYSLAHITAALPEDAILLEYVYFTPIDQSNKISYTNSNKPHYLTLSLDSKGNTSIVDIGDASEIDSLIESVREMFYDKETIINSVTVGLAESELKKSTGGLYEKILAPFDKNFNGNKNLYISTDGQLNLLPYEILPTTDSHYIIEKYKISYLSSGSDLVFGRDVPEPENRALILADPDYDYCGVSAQTSTQILPPNTTLRTNINGITDCLTSQFSSLANARREADSIADYISSRSDIEIDTCFGTRACEESLKELAYTPKALQIITHGYFCDQVSADSNQMTYNPLLYCGLALSGANNIFNNSAGVCENAEDGILTAYEISGLNLVGTELVVLSACESGMGEVMNGEGVFGLRRAFQHAGAESIVMSLWKVPDKETYELMTGFYKYWLNGQSRKAALRQAALDVMRKCYDENGHTHPYFWGAFIMAGR
jgi:CHAT domain-containing protein/Tfp pilus assembly protein PilF